MESRIFNSIDNDDVEEIKLLIDYPNIFQIENDSGLTILQRAIKNKRFAVCDFLLSLDGCQINARNSEGKTALEIALPLNDIPQYFIYLLIKKGADIADIYHDKDGSSLLHYALDYDYIEVAKLLRDLNFQDKKRQTPLQLLLEIALIGLNY